MRIRKVEYVKRALLARGEKELESPNVTKWTVISRQYQGLRGRDGVLRVAHEKHVGWRWYLSKHGYSMRVGPTVGESKPIRDDVVDALIEEGKNL